MIRFISNESEKENIARVILSGLPEWFGLPDSTNEYISCSKKMPFWAYFDKDKPVGFIALKETSRYTAEIYVMGLLKEYHRNGIGHQLWNAFLQYARAKGYEYAQVKTVKKGYYKEYDMTNAFYEKLGFREMECFKTLWDEWNPCQVYIKNIDVVEKALMGKCGFYCGACPTYINKECRGCMDEHTRGDCFSRDCVLQKELHFCGECEDFPCETILTQERCTVPDKEWLRWKKNTTQSSLECNTEASLK